MSETPAEPARGEPRDPSQNPRGDAPGPGSSRAKRPGPGQTGDPELLEAKNALRLVCATVPHLSGLAASVRLHVDSRIETAGVFASGRVVVNPGFLREVGRMGAAFVLAHELMHLALDSHTRSEGTSPELFNYAHDYIINDMLHEEMGCPVPGGGLFQSGARLLSVEKILANIQKDPKNAPERCWSRGRGLGRPQSDLGKALQDALKEAGHDWKPLEHPEDVLSDALEREWFPDTTPQQQEQRRKSIRSVAAKAASLGVLMDRLDKLHGKSDTAIVEAAPSALEVSLQRCYRPPWEVGLQRWIEAIAPGPRTFSRPSRRGTDDPDMVLPGRKREGWTLHIVLDTSGSMESDLPVALGAIAAFCESINIEQIHILQCDTEVTADEFVDPMKLSRYRIHGMGGSDMSPAMLHLAKDSQVEAVVVLTDGYIDFPPERLPYEVLWVIINGFSNFAPSYGHVLHLGT